jgi:hypothetical protein
MLVWFPRLAIVIIVSVAACAGAAFTQAGDSQPPSSAPSSLSAPAANFEKLGASTHDPSLHLFVDDFHIRNAFAMKRVFGQLEKRAQPLVEDLPDRRACWASVMRDKDGKFRMWYESVYNYTLAASGVWGRGKEFGFFPERHPKAIPETQFVVVSYAESDDGLVWTMPKLGIVEWRGSKDNNIVLDGSGAAKQYNGALSGMDGVSVLRDEAAPPRERYKLICHWESVHAWDNEVSKLGRGEAYIKRMWAARGKYLTSSPDGIHWNGPLVWIKAASGGGDYCGVTRDERNGSYWFNDRARAGVPGIPGIRTAGLCQSKDLYHWPVGLEQVFPIGEYEDFGRRYEHHGMVPFNYGDQDMGFLELSDPKRPVAGLLASHRDGQRWQLPNTHVPLLSIGPKGAPDDTIVAATRNAPIAVGDRLYIFYNGRRYTDDPTTTVSNIFLATMRLDGFAGMAVDPEAVHRYGKPGALQTQPLTVTQDQLQINICGHGGTARVSLADENAAPLPGYGLADCLPLPEDATRAVVRWKDRPDLRELKGRRVLVLIQLQSGIIYSVRL